LGDERESEGMQRREKEEKWKKKGTEERLLED